MATNPITSESLTVDFRSLMKIPVGDRAKAASISPDLLQSILSALTPIQIANAFPDYYKRQLPDVSNFVTSYITSRNGGNFNQTGGGDQGYEPTYFDGEDKPKGKRPRGAPEPTIEEMKKKLIEQGIDVEGTYAALGSGAILENDERFGYLQKMSDEELKAAGMQRIQDEYGKTLINLLPTEASTLTKEEVLSRATNNIVPGTTGLEGRAALAKQTYDAFIEAGVSDKQARALVAEVNRENSLRPEYVFGTHTEVAAQAGGRTNYGMFSWGDPSRVKNFKKYMQENGVMDPAGNLIADNSTYLKHQAKFAVQEMQGYKAGREFLENKEVSVEDGTKLLGRYIGWDMAGRRHDARASYDRLAEGRKIIDEVNDKMGKILPENATDAQIEEAREILDQKEREGRADALIRQQFDKASPTSSDFPVRIDGQTAIPVSGEKIRPVGTDYDSLQNFWSQRSPRTDMKDVMRVDSDLLKAAAEGIQMYEAANPQYRVEVFGPSSAARDSGSMGNHGIKSDGTSKALDYVIIDRETGKQLVNLGTHGGGQGYSHQAGGTGLGFDEMTKLHGMVRVAQEHFAPEEKDYRHGTGWTGGDVPFDAMHGDIRGDALGAYDWEKGYTPAFRQQFGMKENFVLGDEGRIKDLGQQLFGQVDEEGNYTNRAGFVQLEDGNITAVSNKLEVPKADEKVAAVSAPEQTQIEASPENTLFIGDSIAQGLRDAAQGQGNTTVGRKPHEVLSAMEEMGAESFKGKRVILSTGLSNNTQDLESVRKQLEFLKSAGADVQIAGMSNSRKDLAPGNQQLQQLSSEYGYKFMGGFKAGKDKIHPTNYSEYADTAAEAIQIAEAAKSVETPAPVTEQQAQAPEIVYDGRRELFQTPETPEIVYDGRRELFQTPEAAETPEIVYDGRRELFQTPEAAISPTPVETKETTSAIPAPVEAKETKVAEAPVEAKETTATPPAPPPEEVRKYALGGNIYEPNEDMTLVDTETGNPIAQIGNDEKIEKTGSAIQVTPETKLKAEELTNKYDSSTVMEDRVSNIEDNLQNQNQKPPDTTNQITQKAREPEKTQTETPYRWRESVASAERPVSPSFNRAMARSKFFGEGHHFTRSAPGSQS